MIVLETTTLSPDTTTTTGTWRPSELPPRLDELPADMDDEIISKLDRIIELLELQIRMAATVQDEADEPEEVDRGYL